jgi:hypothetical protein
MASASRWFRAKMPVSQCWMKPSRQQHTRSKYPPYGNPTNSSEHRAAIF